MARTKLSMKELVPRLLDLDHLEIKMEKVTFKWRNPEGNKYLKETCTHPSCDCCPSLLLPSLPPECAKHRTKAGCNFDDRCAFHHSYNSKLAEQEDSKRVVNQVRPLVTAKR